MLKYISKALKDDRGFTLIELMVVIAIIGILAAVAIPSFSRSKDSAQIARIRSDIKTLESAAAMYYADNGEFPDTNDDGYIDSSEISEYLRDGYPDYVGTLGDFLIDDETGKVSFELDQAIGSYEDGETIYANPDEE